jgi:hypothetical protein
MPAVMNCRRLMRAQAEQGWSRITSGPDSDILIFDTATAG